MISGSDDEKVIVSDIVNRQHEATFDAHTGGVLALAICGRTLLSTGNDCTIGVWALGTWSHLMRVRVSDHVPEAWACYCLAASGSMLLCGGAYKDEESFGFLLVLDSQSMSCQYTLQLDHYIHRLLSVRGEVWGTLADESVVVWGKAERGRGSGMSEAGRA